jgi:hypothetical protein
MKSNDAFKKLIHRLVESAPIIQSLIRAIDSMTAFIESHKKCMIDSETSQARLDSMQQSILSMESAIRDLQNRRR